MTKCSIADNVKVLRTGRYNQFISLEVAGEGKTLTIIAVYIPHKTSKWYGKRVAEDLFTEIIEHAVQRQNMGPVIIVGDFNGRTAGHQPKEAETMWQRRIEDDVLNAHRRKLLLLLEVLGMVVMNGTRISPDTWKHMYLIGRKASTIDYLCCCPEDAKMIASFQIGRILDTSDHKVLKLCLKWNHMRDCSKQTYTKSALAKKRRGL